MLVLGYKASTEQFGPDELLDWVVEAEKCGFDSITASDHFHPWRDDGVQCFSVWPWLGAVGARTRRVQFGTGVTCPTFRYNPAVIAEHAATLGAMFPGRFWLGLGTGEAPSERATTGCWPDYRDRHDRLVEAIAVIRRLWGGEHLTYRGRYFQTRDAHLYVKSPSAIPLIVGASGPTSVRLAGQHADGWMVPAGTDSVDHYRDVLVPALERGARDAHRDPRSLARAVELYVMCTDNPTEALADARLWASTLLDDREKYGVYDPRDLQKFAGRLSDAAVERGFLISANPADHVAFAERFIQLGASQLFFHAPGPRQGEFIQFYGKEVLPRLRQKYAGAMRPAA
ncbi:MAG: TIGR03557 family F420-dependent LLM class oxidoreductase [Chloroflexota bacterium]